MIKFLKIQISPQSALYENISYLPDILKLILDNKHRLFDDYFFEDNIGIARTLVALIERTAPYFWVIVGADGTFRGFVYLDDWQGSSIKRHSATVTTCIEPKYWGNFTRFAGKRFVKYVFKRYKLVKLKAEVYSHNRNAITLLKKLGFKKECTLKSETIVGQNLTDIDVYSIINSRPKLQNNDKDRLL